MSATAAESHQLRPRPIDQLTERDYTIMQMIALGRKTREISGALGYSYTYIEKLIIRIYDLTGQDHRLGLVRWYLEYMKAEHERRAAIERERAAIDWRLALVAPPDTSRGNL